MKTSQLARASLMFAPQLFVRGHIDSVRINTTHQRTVLLFYADWYALSSNLICYLMAMVVKNVCLPRLAKTRTYNHLGRPAIGGAAHLLTYLEHERIAGKCRSPGISKKAFLIGGRSRL